MKLRTSLALAALLCAAINLNAQNKEKTYEFKKITPADFVLKDIKVDTSYGAVIIADVGQSSFVGNNKGWFSLIYKHQRRIKILNAKAFDIATVNIPLYNSTKSDDEEKLESLKASTYNLVNGVVEETKLDKNDVFKEVEDCNHQLRKFTMPALKEGSIIEYSYTINSDYLFNLQPWSFQGEYPRLWSEYELNLPQFFQYVFLSQGYLPYETKTTKSKFQSFSVRVPNSAGRDDVYNLTSNNTISRWGMKDVPAIREESFTSTIRNHIAKIQFQMSGRQFPDMPYVDVMGSWVKASTEMMAREDFGAEFSNANNWVNSTIKEMNLNGKEPSEKAKIIYKYVQQNFSNKGMHGIYTSQKLKETLRTKKGYAADINLLLTLLMREAGLFADPVILSTRSHGKTIEAYPLIDQYNYVVTKLMLDESIIYLDATDKHLGFGKIPNFCYNGIGISLAATPKMEPFHPDNEVEASVTNIALLNGEKNGLWTGKVNTYLGYYESTDVRDELDEKGKDSYKKKLQESYTDEFKIDDLDMADLEDNEKVVLMKHSIMVNWDTTNNLIYFNPMLKEGLKENYFKSTERNYPVELPYKIDKTYTFYIEVPDGYEVDEVPKSARVKLNEDEGLFEYLISKTESQVSLRTKLSINKTVFMPEEYESLKNFFDYVVKKHAEQIVFKKK